MTRTGKGDARGAGARPVAMEVLRRVRETGAYANLVLPAEIERAGLDGRDAAFATELASGTLRMQGTLDWVLSLYADRPPEAMDPPVLDALRLGAYQLLHTDVPPYAAVGETVALAGHRGAAGFVNAVLRRLAEGRGSIPWPSRDGDLESYLRIRYAHPAWVVRLWLDELGPREAEGLLAADNVFPGVAVRARRGTGDELEATFLGAGLDVRTHPVVPDCLVVSGGGAPSRWPGWEEGRFTVQDPASVLAADAVEAPPGGSVADLCAGPGGKAGRLAEGNVRLVAMELHEGRARRAQETLRRLRVAEGAVVVRADATSPPVRTGVDAVLVDAPCSGLGVLRRRPEARWRVTPADVDRSADLQGRLLDAAFALVGGGGALVYAVCTVTRAESSDLVERFLARTPAAALEPVHPGVPRAPGWEGRHDLQLLPHHHATDGMYIARVRRISHG